MPFAAATVVVSQLAPIAMSLIDGVLGAIARTSATIKSHLICGQMGRPCRTKAKRLDKACEFLKIFSIRFQLEVSACADQWAWVAGSPTPQTGFVTAILSKFVTIAFA
jgi:hypothetical protein